MKSSWCQYLAYVWLLISQRYDVAAATEQSTASKAAEARTALGWLYLLSNLAAQPQADRPPARQGVISTSNNQAKPAPMSVAADMPQSPASGVANALIQEQFIRGVLQGLQQGTVPSGSPTAQAAQPAQLADFLAQINVANTAIATTPAPEPAITAPTVEKYALNGNTDYDYDYIDFKNGSRIKYELDEPEPTDDIIPSKMLYKPLTYAVSNNRRPVRPPLRQYTYHPVYTYTNFGSSPRVYYYRIG